jgi:hypothetical protein
MLICISHLLKMRLERASLTSLMSRKVRTARSAVKSSIDSSPRMSKREVSTEKRSRGNQKELA